MKKENVSVDFVAFGELDDDTTKKLTQFNENVKKDDRSHIAIIRPGPGLLSDQLVTSPILNGDGSVSGNVGGGDVGGDAGGFEFGIDPSVDPELALALRMSMEEEKARVEEQAKVSLPEIKEEDEAGQPLLGDDAGPSASAEEKEKKDADGDEKMVE
jgi:26S proteasome regulatory subunit N10